MAVTRDIFRQTHRWGWSRLPGQTAKPCQGKGLWATFEGLPGCAEACLDMCQQVQNLPLDVHISTAARRPYGRLATEVPNVRRMSCAVTTAEKGKT